MMVAALPFLANTTASRSPRSTRTRRSASTRRMNDCTTQDRGGEQRYGVRQEREEGCVCQVEGVNIVSIPPLGFVPMALIPCMLLPNTYNQQPIPSYTFNSYFTYLYDYGLRPHVLLEDGEVGLAQRAVIRRRHHAQLQG